MTERKIMSLYDSTVEVVFTPGNHSYKVNGEKKISVTGALGIIDKPALKFWAVNLACDYISQRQALAGLVTVADIETARRLHTERKEEAANIGKMVHAWAEDYIKGLNPPMPEIPEVVYGVTAFLDWVDARKPKFVASEKLVYSRKHDYVGQLDCIVRFADENYEILHIGDFKTSGGFYNDQRYQVAAYEEAEREESGQVYGDKLIMRFAKEDKYDKKTGELIEKAGSFAIKTIPHTDHESDMRAFLGCLAVKKREAAISAAEKEEV